DGAAVGRGGAGNGHIDGTPGGVVDAATAGGECDRGAAQSVGPEIGGLDGPGGRADGAGRAGGGEDVVLGGGGGVGGEVRDFIADLEVVVPEDAAEVRVDGEGADDVGVAEQSVAGAGRGVDVDGDVAEGRNDALVGFGVA